jgi:hypothetical protein
VQIRVHPWLKKYFPNSTAVYRITNRVSGSSLSLSWPADQGWTLEVQTNHLSGGVSSNTNDWLRISGSTGINSTNIIINPANPTEFYRLVWP